VKGPEHELTQRLRRGEPAAFTALVDLYGGRVLATARRFAICESDAEDLTQDVFVALARALPTFRGDSMLSTFVYRVAVNVCLKWRQRQRPDAVALDTLALIATDTESPDDALARRELADRIDAALDQLTDDHRAVVVLHEFQGLTYAECAAALQIPVGTVKSRLYHAFQRLRPRLQDVVDSPSAPLGSPLAEVLP
jgi:RNA polymerase sigma-70 factor (ECF subfamily)